MRAGRAFFCSYCPVLSADRAEVQGHEDGIHQTEIFEGRVVAAVSVSIYVRGISEESMLSVTVKRAHELDEVIGDPVRLEVIRRIGR